MPAMAREWTNTAGKKLVADFVEKKGAAGAEIAVVKTSAGKVHEIPLSSLSAADQEFVKSQPATAAKTLAAKRATEKAPVSAKTAAAPAASKFQKMLEGKLVALEGKKISKYTMKEEPRYYAFYFSAHWCPPCRAFTPKLVEFYNAQEGKKKDFEIIFVSSDHSEEEMEEYMKVDSMPWPVISYRNVARMKEIKEFCGDGIPCLVLVDRDGKVISDTNVGGQYLGPQKVMNDIPEKTKAAEATSSPSADTSDKN
ncbi:MAG: Thioredoxin [Verrucomicrobiales bacterium]|nr:Thioredoxin [Verrucomicrobiales bacterium]